MYLEKTVSYSLKINPDTQSQIWAKCNLLQFTHVCVHTNGWCHSEQLIYSHFYIHKANTGNCYVNVNNLMTILNLIKHLQYLHNAYPKICLTPLSNQFTIHVLVSY